MLQRILLRKLVLPSGPQRAAYLAALGLITIQVGIGVIMKAAQQGGVYKFSPSGSIAISEFLKMLLSTAFFYRECKSRALNGIAPSTRGLGAAYRSVPGDDTVSPSNEEVEDSKEEPSSPSSLLLQQDDEESGRVHHSSGPLQLNARTFWDYIRGEVTTDVRFGFFNLALFYILINNSIFLSYKMADPGTIQLTKSGVTLITALVMIVTLDQRLSKIQWMAIAMQISGLVVTQYQPGSGSIYPFDTYALLLFQVFLSATSGVYNQALLKADASSLHADNMVLYAAGSFVNLLCHILIKAVKTSEPHFFQGYGSLGAVLVIASNVFIGLAITAVYRYADAIIKCFATAIATSILLYISPILFKTPISFLVAPGTFIIFIASWLYMDNPPPKTTGPAPVAEPNKGGFFFKFSALAKKYPFPFISITTGITVTVVLALSMYEAAMPDQVRTGGASAQVAPPVPDVVEDAVEPDTVASPFKNTLGFIRWNSALPQRIPLLMKYQPFFYDVHISMPHLLEEPKKDDKKQPSPDPKDSKFDPNFHNLTHDQFENGEMIYEQLARTMQLVLDTEPEIDGLMYWHFDAWIDPLGWSTKDLSIIHFPMTSPPHHSDWPSYQCTNDTKGHDWWGFKDGQKFHQKSLLATAQLSALDLGFVMDEKEFCLAWTDIYFIPRRFFKDYVVAANIFHSFKVHHEVAVPTILHILDNTYRRTAFTPAMDLFRDCWGHCCASNPTVEDITRYRCGHRIEYRDENVTKAFYDKLDSEALILGMQFNSSQMANLTDIFGSVEDVEDEAPEDSATDLPISEADLPEGDAP